MLHVWKGDSMNYVHFLNYSCKTTVLYRFCFVLSLFVSQVYAGPLEDLENTIAFESSSDAETIPKKIEELANKKDGLSQIIKEIQNIKNKDELINHTKNLLELFKPFKVFHSIGMGSILSTLVRADNVSAAVQMPVDFNNSTYKFLFGYLVNPPEKTFFENIMLALLEQCSIHKIDVNKEFIVHYNKTIHHQGKSLGINDPETHFVQGGNGRYDEESLFFKQKTNWFQYVPMIPTVFVSFDSRYYSSDNIILVLGDFIHLRDGINRLMKKLQDSMGSAKDITKNWGFDDKHHVYGDLVKLYDALDTLTWDSSVNTFLELYHYMPRIYRGEYYHDQNFQPMFSSLFIGFTYRDNLVRALEIFISAAQAHGINLDEAKQLAKKENLTEIEKMFEKKTLFHPIMLLINLHKHLSRSKLLH